MKPLPFSHISFMGSTLNPKDYLNHIALPQIALIGRSNVGKSSLINHLCSTKTARISATPGKTQTFNFYCIDDQLLLIDFPGYGYARISSQLKEEWAKNFGDYFQHKKNIKLVLWLLDIRHTPSKEDLTCLHFLLFHKISFLIIFTKCDQLRQNEIQTKAEQHLIYLKSQKSFEAPYIFYSIKDVKAKFRLRKDINQALL